MLPKTENDFYWLLFFDCEYICCDIQKSNLWNFFNLLIWISNCKECTSKLCIILVLTCPGNNWNTLRIFKLLFKNNFVHVSLDFPLNFSTLSTFRFVKQLLSQTIQFFIAAKHNSVNTARFLKYVWPFYNIMHERVNELWQGSPAICSCLNSANNNRSARKRCEIYSKLTIKTSERRHWRVFIVNFEHISHVFFCYWRRLNFGDI